MAHAEKIREELEKMGDQELLALVKTETLTKQARKVAVELLAERGKSVDDESIEKTSASLNANRELKESDGKFLGRCVSGKASLYDAFWVLGFGIGLAIAVPVAVLMSLTKATPWAPMVSIPGGLLLLVALGFRDICIWRCALNVKWIAWGLIARAWLVLSWFLLFAALAGEFKRGW